MQYAGFATLGVVFPEFNNADQWIEQATQQTLADIRSGVYADGVETEETSSYHKVRTRFIVNVPATTRLPNNRWPPMPSRKSTTSRC